MIKYLFLYYCFQTNDEKNSDGEEDHLGNILYQT